MLKKVFYRYFKSFTKSLFDCIFLGCNCYCCTICPFLYLHEVLNHWLNVCLETASLFHSSKCPYKCNRYSTCESQLKLANFSSALPTLPTTLRVVRCINVNIEHDFYSIWQNEEISWTMCVFHNQYVCLGMSYMVCLPWMYVPSCPWKEILF